MRAQAQDLECSIEAERTIVNCLDEGRYIVTVFIVGMNGTYNFTDFTGEALEVNTTGELTFTNATDPNPVTEHAISVIYPEGVDYDFLLESDPSGPTASNDEPCFLEVFGSSQLDCDFCTTEITSVSSTPSDPDAATGTITVEATTGNTFTDPRFRIFPDPNNVGRTLENTFTNLPARSYMISMEEFGSDFQCGESVVVVVEETGGSTIELNEVIPDEICSIKSTAIVDLTQYEAALTDDAGSFAYFDEMDNEIVDPTAYEVSDGTDVKVVFTADAGSTGETNLVFTLTQAIVDSETITIDLLCEGVAPGTCPPIILDWEEPKISVEKYMAIVVVLETEETFTRMLKGTPPMRVRPFLPPRIVGEDVFITLAPVAEDGTVGAYAMDRLMVVDCESTLPELEERSAEIISEFSLSPNPTQDLLNVAFANPNAENILLEVQDMTGKILQVLQSSGTQESMDVSNLP
ncbi:MAG: T9SS type A sorting domain-containing protein, partial [Bacteroidota bacterium]